MGRSDERTWELDSGFLLQRDSVARSSLALFRTGMGGTGEGRELAGVKLSGPLPGYSVRGPVRGERGGLWDGVLPQSLETQLAGSPRSGCGLRRRAEEWRHL